MAISTFSGLLRSARIASAFRCLRVSVSEVGAFPFPSSLSNTAWMLGIAFK